MDTKDARLMRFELFVALRYLKAKRKQTMVSVISAISILGITAGVMALVIALALSTGFKEDIQAKIIGATSHVNLLRADGKALQDFEPLISRLGALPHITGVSPAIFNQVFISAFRSQGAVLKGVDPKREAGISDFFLHVVEGDAHALDKPMEELDPEAPPRPENLILGKELARALGVRVGDVVQIMSLLGKLTPSGRAPAIRKFRVAGLFESGLWDYDANWVYVSLQSAQRLFTMPSGSSSVLQLRTDDLEGVAAIADTVRGAAGDGFTTTTWIDLNKPLFSALKLEKLALFITIGLIIFVASLNIVTTLIMMVLEKQRDIAILTAMGATQATIMSVFVLQGLAIGFIGTILGAIFGIGACEILDTFKLIKLQAEIYSIPYVPFHVKVLDVAVVTGTAVLISLLATLYPARNASRLDPVEVLRYE